VRSIDSALNITLNTNGRVLRNLISGADTVMSHILHFYHLAAADFVDVSALGSPWDDGSGGPAFGTMTTVALVPLTTVNPWNGGVTKELVESYVAALNMRKEAHSMGAIFSGRQPTSNAIVPGGVTTIFNAADVTAFTAKLNKIRNFINAYYIPDVVFVATRTVGGAGQNWQAYWGVGTNPGRLLSYGEYPLAGAEGPFNNVVSNSTNMLIHRGVVDYVNDSTDPSTVTPFDTTQIKEFVDSSYYSSPDGLHPSVGATTPLTGTTLQTAMNSGPQYSWLKAPRYGGIAAEVGPLARMMVTALSGSGANVVQTDSNTLTLVPGLGATYNAYQLVTGTVTRINSVFGTSLNLRNLFSPLGRHAARALECKYVADAMYSWLAELTLNNAQNDGEITYPYTTTTATGSGYVYKAIPKATVMGEGLAEAPRGALGHWITIQSKKIGNYQCVVPSTWNACPEGNTHKGPAEAALMGLNVGTGTEDAICNIARMLHPYDFCIACAVHVVTPEGKDIAKFEMGLDGTIKKL
jgi:hydrogenase large subunit